MADAHTTESEGPEADPDESPDKIAERGDFIAQKTSTVANAAAEDDVAEEDVEELREAIRTVDILLDYIAR